MLPKTISYLHAFINYDEIFEDMEKLNSSNEKYFKTSQYLYFDIVCEV
jgi:hypothetical protein